MLLCQRIGAYSHSACMPDREGCTCFALVHKFRFILLVQTSLGNPKFMHLCALRAVFHTCGLSASWPLVVLVSHGENSECVATLVSTKIPCILWKGLTVLTNTTLQVFQDAVHCSLIFHERVQCWVMSWKCNKPHVQVCRLNTRH